ERHPFSLSGGEKRRLSVATATVTRPSILILDEPTYGQDRRTTFEMMGSILALAGGHAELPGSVNGGNGAEGPSARSIILVTHDMRLVADFASRAVVVHAGEIA